MITADFRYKLALENCMLVVVPPPARGGDTRNAVENLVNDFCGLVANGPCLFHLHSRILVPVSHRHRQRFPLNRKVEYLRARPLMDGRTS